MSLTTEPVTADVSKDGDVITATGRFTLPSIPKISLPKFDVAKVELPGFAKPVYAYVGVADLWIEQLKAVPAELDKVGERLAIVPSVVKSLPAQAKALRGEVEDRAGSVGERAAELYTALSIRGERLVTQIRKQPAAEVAIEEAKEAIRKGEAAVIAAGKAVQAGEKAVVGAADKIG